MILCCPTCSQTLPDAVQNIDMDAGIIVANGQFTCLTNQEFEVFMTLHHSLGKKKTREQLLRAIASFIDKEPEIKIIDVLIHRVRKKTEKLGFSIESIWGEGYRLIQKGGINE